MPDALIGCSGFVGSTLARQAVFASGYRSTDIGEIRGRSFGTVVCAGAPAQKWAANQDPEADRRKIESLVGHLGTFQCETLVLISTVDVFRHPVAVDEESAADGSGLHPYGLHRLALEKAVAQRFPRHLIVRLPGLVGAGLRKNVLFDLLNDNGTDLIDSRGVFQYYPVAHLWRDIQLALRAALKLVHLTAEPVSVAEVAAFAFDKAFDRVLPASPPRYDLRTRHAGVFGAQGSYQYTKHDSLQAIRAYARTEPRAPQAAALPRP